MNDQAHRRSLLEALRVLERSRAETPVDTRRAWERHSVRAQCVLIEGGASVRGRIIETQARDVSRGGVGLLCAEPIEPGRLLRCVFVDQKTELFSATAAVRFARSVVPGVHLLGLAFALDAAHLFALGVPARELREAAQTGGAECSPIDSL